MLARISSFHCVADLKNTVRMWYFVLKGRRDHFREKGPMSNTKVGVCVCGNTGIVQL